MCKGIMHVIFRMMQLFSALYTLYYTMHPAAQQGLWRHEGVQQPAADLHSEQEEDRPA